MQVAVQPLDNLRNGDRLCFDDGFHDQLAGGIHHRDSGRFLVNVQSNVFCTFHDGCSFLLQGQRQRHKLTSKGASFYNALYTRRMNSCIKTTLHFSTTYAHGLRKSSAKSHVEANGNAVLTPAWSQGLMKLTQNSDPLLKPSAASAKGDAI